MSDTPPGGTRRQIQFHSAGGVFGGVTGFTWNGSVVTQPATTFTAVVTVPSLVVSYGGLGISVTAGDTRIGTSPTQKVGFWNTTPVIQPAGANQAAITDSTGGTAASALVDVGAVPTQANINNNFATVHVLLAAIRTALVDTGIIRGAIADEGLIQQWAPVSIDGGQGSPFFVGGSDVVSGESLA